MNKKLLDILVCPFDKVTSLDLFELQSSSSSQAQSQQKIVENSEIDELNSKVNGSIPPRNNSIQPEPNQSSEQSTIVKEGLLLCRTCNRFYPITSEIPIILPDELRDKKKDIEFLKKWKELIPSDLLKTLKPWTV